MSDPDRRSDPSPSSHRTLVSARDVGGRIRARLEQLGIKRSEAAHRMGMRRPGTFYDWVDGKQLPSLDYLPDLVRVLGMTAEELMGIAAGQNPPFATWHAFLAGLEARGEKLTEGERAALAGLPWPSGREPTVTSYEMALAAIRTAAPSG